MACGGGGHSRHGGRRFRGHRRGYGGGAYSPLWMSYLPHTLSGGGYGYRYPSYGLGYGARTPAPHTHAAAPSQLPAMFMGIAALAVLVLALRR